MDEPPSAAAPSASEEAVAEVMSSPSVPEGPTTASQPLLSGSDKRHVASGDDESFQWPLATRVSYSLEGHYRGPVHGQATVEWLSLGARYQVHIDAIVGPSFAPIGSWRLSSEGELGPDGLTPRRHESVDRVVIRGSRLRSSEFDDDTVRLNDGTTLPRQRLPSRATPNHCPNASALATTRSIAWRAWLSLRPAWPG